MKKSWWKWLVGGIVALLGTIAAIIVMLLVQRKGKALAKLATTVEINKTKLEQKQYEQEQAKWNSKQVKLSHEVTKLRRKVFTDEMQLNHLEKQHASRAKLLKDIKTWKEVNTQ